MNELQAIKLLLLENAEYYGQELTENQLIMYSSDLSDLSIQDIKSALREIRKNPKINRIPLPAIIRNAVVPFCDDESIAVDCSSKIVEAVSRGFDSSNAKTFLGPIAWEIVKRQGGWTLLNQTLLNSEIPIRQAQWREMAKSIIKMDKVLKHAKRIGIENKKEGAEEIGSLISGLLVGGNDG